jgi:protein-S-isoprenylcysteine O-methyltransferase Ste14
MYRLSRNPVYCGFHLLTLGAVLYTLSPIVAILGGIAIVVHHRIIHAEETHLERELGQEYRRYRSSVPRYLGLPR